jgi:hypothetical protein
LAAPSESSSALVKQASVRSGDHRHLSGVAVDQVQVDLGQEAVVGEAARQRLPQRLWSSSPSMVA